MYIYAALLDNWSELLTIFFLSIIKFGIGLFTAILLDIDFLPKIIANLIGGALGILIFTYFGSWIKRKYIQWKYKKERPKRFNSWNRFLIKLRKSLGLVGIAFLSPIVLTIPIGVVLALQITNSKAKVFGWMFGACIFWSAIFFLLSHFLGIRIHL